MIFLGNSNLRNSFRIATILSAMVLQTACGEFSAKSAATPQPEETVESMLALVASESSDCAPMTATYSCPATADEVAEGKNEPHVDGLLLERKEVGQHVQLIDQKKLSLFNYVVSNYMLDAGGLIVDGQIKDKSEGVRSAMMMLANKLATPIVRDTIVGTFGFDPSAEMQKMEIKTLNAGYVSSCKGRKLHGHYVFEQSASKFTFEKLADGNLNITSFTMDRGGPIVKETRTCKFVAKEVSTSAEVATEKLKTGAAEISNTVVNGVKEKLSTNFPSVLNVQFISRKDWVLSEPIIFRFERKGMITDRNIFQFAKGHLGMKDGIFDDVKVESDFTVLTLDVNTMKLSGVRANGNKAEVGTVVKDGETYNLDVTVDADYTAKDRTLKLK
ncbi:MAG: hypothetical protein J0L82_17270 [Deltaproteobacteria bacterium]|jgi:hypothetical protein|nr:hypothetical protein [Deltaproteobacteria bacterium]